MNLSRQQLEEIRQFVIKKGIIYLDVQMEIIDHVASAIEEKMEAFPELDFDTSLKQVYANFGIFGFSTIEDAIRDGLNKKYNRFFWRTFRSFFSYKYILLLVLGIGFIYQAQIYFMHKEWLFSVALIVPGLMIMLMQVVALFLFKVKGYLSFSISKTYFPGGAGLFFVLAYRELFMNKDQIGFTDSIFGLDIANGVTAVVLVLSFVYFIAGFKTMKLGRDESRELMIKYQYLI